MSLLLLAAAALPACVQHVELVGDGAARDALLPVLDQRRVPVGEGSADCPPLRVELRREGDRFALAFTDEAGRLQERTASDPALAAALIDGWLHADLARPLLVLPTPVAGPAAAPAADRRAWALAVVGELGRGSNWERGIAARVATGLGPFSAEALARYAAADAEGAGGLAPASHDSAELLVGIRLPLAFGGLLLAPGVALGAGLDSTNRSSCESCTRVVRDEAYVTSAAARAEASLLAGIGIGGAFALEALVGASVTPFGAAPERTPSWAAGDPAFALPGPASARVRAGLGLSWRQR
ncbi:hypothetical protein [Vulgatibacter sp.]|uniref:hypothetical protein n=1 Tax=Vulgatibacter sp. TaxID=1971226 RepID=UPI003566C688